MSKYKVKATLRGRRLETDISFSTKEAAEKYARETNMYNWEPMQGL